MILYVDGALKNKHRRTLAYKILEPEGPVIFPVPTWLPSQGQKDCDHVDYTL